MRLLITNGIYDEHVNVDSSSLVYRVPCIQFKNKDWTVKTTHEIRSLTLNNLIREVGDIPSVILIWMCGTYVSNNLPFFRRVHKKKMPITLCWYIDDIHNDKKRRVHLFEYMHIILNSYAYCMDMFFNHNATVYWFPHYVNELLIQEITFNNNPTPKLLLSGQITERIYPARHKLLDKSKEDKRIYVLSHPGYSNRNKHTYCGKKYYEFINNFLAAFTCCALKERPYLVSKFFEIISVGTLLVAYDEHIKPQMKELGFEDGVNYISCSMDNVDKIIDFVLCPENRSCIDSIRYNGYILSKNNAFLSSRVQSFCNFLDNRR